MGKYCTLFKLAFIQGLKNYKALVGLSIFLITCLVIFAHLWKIVAAKTGAANLNEKHLLWYIAFNEWVLVSIPDTQDDMEQDLRSGRLAYLLPRPISYLGATFAEALGTLSINLIVLGFVTCLFTWLTVSSLPFHPVGLIVAFAFALLGGMLAILFKMVIGLSAFWLGDVDPFYWVWEKLLFMLGGLMLPLAVYPQWLQKLAYLTPFPAILGERSALALDFNLNQISFLACSLIGWSAAGCFCLLIVYKKGMRILNIEGG